MSSPPSTTETAEAMEIETAPGGSQQASIQTGNTIGTETEQVPVPKKKDGPGQKKIEKTEIKGRDFRREQAERHQHGPL